jgi:hypothetical protein
VTIDAELGVVGEIGAELQEEGLEILVDAVEVINRARPAGSTGASCLNILSTSSSV